jgi:hypothetical protein
MRLVHVMRPALLAGLCVVNILRTDTHKKTNSDGTFMSCRDYHYLLSQNLQRSQGPIDPKGFLLVVTRRHYHRGTSSRLKLPTLWKDQ